MAIDYQQLMEHSIEKLSDLIRQRQKVDNEIGRLLRMASWYARHLHRTSPQSAAANALHAEAGTAGLTDAVRQVLSMYRMQLSPVLIRDLLPSIGFDTSRYAEPLPCIHAVLKRLAASREVTKSQLPSGGTVYAWVEPSERQEATRTELQSLKAL